MTVKDFCHALASNPDAKMHWMLPDKSFVLQVWVANDVDRRLLLTAVADSVRLSGARR